MTDRRPVMSHAPPRDTPDPAPPAPRAGDGPPLLPASGPTAEPFRPDDRLARLLGGGLTFFYILRMEGTTFRAAWVGDHITGILGYTVEEALRPDWWKERVHPEDLPRTLANHAGLLTSGHLVHEYRFR